MVEVARQDNSAKQNTSGNLSDFVVTPKKLLQAIAKQVGKLSSATNTKLKAVNTALEEALGPITSPAVLSVKKQAFIDKYSVQVISDHEVSVDLGATSRIDFMCEAQRLALQLYGLEAIWPDDLERWATDPLFQAVPKSVIKVDCSTAGANDLNKSKPEDQERSNFSFEDLAVAHVAYFIATGKDLFAGKVMEAHGGALYSHADKPDASNHIMGS